jgi:putative lipoic acid-binding regulatory protein
MDNILVVQVLNGSEHLLHQLCSVILVEVGVLYNAIEQLTSSAGFHHNVDVTVINVHFEEVDNVRVAYSSQDEQFFF